MPKTFIIKNNQRKKIGEAAYSGKKFKLSVSSAEEKKRLEDLFNGFLKNGIRDLGEVILDKPIKAGDPLFFGEVQNQMARRGYIMIEKK